MARQKKIENMTDDERIRYWADRREQEKRDRLKRVSNLSIAQINAVRLLYEQLDNILDTALYPDMGGIRAITALDLQDLADANSTLKYEFGLDTREQG